MANVSNIEVPLNTSSISKTTNISEPILYSDAQESFYIKLFLGIIILALLGYNIFTYLKYGTDMFGNILISETKSLVKTTKNVGKKTISGVKQTLNTTKDVLEKTIVNENTLDKSLKYKQKNKTNIKKFTNYENKKNKKKIIQGFVILDKIEVIEVV